MGATAPKVVIPVDGENKEFSAILLRDLCQCSACIHQSTRQKLFSTTDISRDIRARTVTPNPWMAGVFDIVWDQDVPGFHSEHTTSVDTDSLRGICEDGVTPGPFRSPLASQVLWDANSCGIADFDHDVYMQDDATLYKALVQLRTHGLVFLTNVPESEKTVSAIAERIGSVKSTFYGYTWDGKSTFLLGFSHTLMCETVRTVPSAINVAYTSSDLSFHADLLYFENPAHIQLLHCMQASSTGGASVFVDAFKCAIDMYKADLDAFNVLATLPVNYHYKHVDSNLYTATKPVIDLCPLNLGDRFYSSLPEFMEAWESNRQKIGQSTDTELSSLNVVDCLEKINWGPPFMAPFSLQGHSMEQARSCTTARECLNQKVDSWHAAAEQFGLLLHQPENLYERLLRPGECVLFNNTRVLHGRKAFDSDDIGKARWLRGAYVDEEPYLSKIRVLKHRFEDPPIVGGGSMKASNTMQG